MKHTRMHTTPHRLAAVALGTLAFAGTVGAANFTWLSTNTDAGPYAWDSASNWTDGAVFPNATTATVVVTSNIGDNQTITLNQGISLASLTLGDSDGTHSYTLAANGGSLTFANNGQLTIINTSKGDTLSANVGMTGSLGITNSSANAVTLSGAISGAGTLTVNKTGTGAVILTSSNSYTGTTALSGGTLYIGNDNVLGASTLNFNTASLGAAGGARTLSNAVSLLNNGSITGTNNLTINGTFTNSGGDRTLLLAGTGTTTLAGNVYLSEGSAARTLKIRNSGNLIISGVIADSSGSAVGSSLSLSAESPTVTITNSNTYSGTTQLLVGTLNVGNDHALGTSTLNINNGATLIASGGARALNNSVSMIGHATFSGTNSLTFNGAFAQVAVSKNLTVNTTNGVTLAGNVYLTSDDVTARTLTLLGSGPILISGAIANNSAGNSVASNLTHAGTSTVTLSGSNSYTGTTQVSYATLIATKAAALPGYNTANRIVIGNGATLAVQTGDGTTGWDESQIGTLIASASINAASGSIVGLDTTTGDFSYTSNISRGISLAKLGANTLTLSGANTYTGNTRVRAGTLLVTTTAALPNYSSANKVVISGGATLAVRTGDGTAGWSESQIGTLIASVSAADNTAAIGFDTTAGDFSYAASITKGVSVAKLGINTLTLSGANTYTGNTRVSAGTLKAGNGNAFGTGTITVTGGVLDLRDFNVGNIINITGTGASVLLATSTQALTTNVAAGSNYAGLQRTGVGAIGATTASLLAGTAAGDSVVTTSWTNDNHGAGNVVSDVLDLAGTGAGNLFVLQMTYADNANDSEAMLGYWNTGSSQWVNAIYGGAYSGVGTFVNGSYDNNLVLGNWGRDASSNTVWAVVDHNSEFAVVAAPEPAVLTLFGLGGLAILRRRKKG